MLAAVGAGGFRLVGAWLLVASIFPFVGGAPTACAAEGSRAVLVVDTGESEHRMCVELPRQEVSGTDLIVLAGEQHGLSYRFGYGGGAVCMLAGVGTSDDDCFEEYPEFWGYWRGDGSGGWQWSSTGAGSTRVSDGDVEGWSWGSGNDGASHPAPPPTTFSSVCPARSAPAGRTRPKPDQDAEPVPEPRQERRKTVMPRREAERPPASQSEDRAEARRRPRAGADARRETPRRQKPRQKRDPLVADSQPRATGYEEGLPVPSTGPPSSNGGGPPPAGMAAVAAACALGGAGAWLTRRRRDRS